MTFGFDPEWEKLFREQLEAMGPVQVRAMLARNHWGGDRHHVVASRWIEERDQAGPRLSRRLQVLAIVVSLCAILVSLVAFYRTL